MKAWVEGERLGVYDIDFVLNNIAFKRNENNDHRAILDGYEVKTSPRFFNHLIRSTKCYMCGVAGKFFALERFPDGCYLKLYTVKHGFEILMNKDHVIPQSKGGMNNPDNVRTCCIICNQLKGDNYD